MSLGEAELTPTFCAVQHLIIWQGLAAAYHSCDHHNER